MYVWRLPDVARSICAALLNALGDELAEQRLREVLPKRLKRLQPPDPVTGVAPSGYKLEPPSQINLARGGTIDAVRLPLAPRCSSFVFIISHGDFPCLFAVSYWPPSLPVLLLV